jgi:hypothetical protein
MALELNNGIGAAIPSFSRAEALKRFGIDLLPGCRVLDRHFIVPASSAEIPQARYHRRYDIIEIVGDNFYRLLGRAARDFTRDPQCMNCRSRSTFWPQSNEASSLQTHA